MKRIDLCSLAVVLVGSLAACQQSGDAVLADTTLTSSLTEDPEADDASSDQLAPLRWLVGDWECEGAYRDVPPLVQAHPLRASFPIQRDARGTWLTGRFTERRTPHNPNPRVQVDHITIDEAADQGIRAAVDNNPGRIVATFSGYEGDVTTYTGAYLVAGLTLPFGQTLTRINSRKFTSESSIDIGAGPQVFVAITCSR